MEDRSTHPDPDGRFRAIYEYAPDAYYLSDLHGNFVDGNRAAEETIGYARDELIGKNFLSLNLLAAEDVGRAANLLAQSARGEFVGPIEFVLTRKDGSQVPVEIHTRPISIDGQQLILGITRDISERKQAEAAIRQSQAELRESHRELERRVAQRTEELRDANAELRAEVAQKEQAQADLEAIVKGTASKIGEDFFASFVGEIARRFDVAYVLVCEHLDAPVSRVRTLAFWSVDGLAEDIEYDLASGPCAVTASGEQSFFPEGIQELFPDDQDLVDMQAESYCGFVLHDRQGRTIGHLALLDTRPMEFNLCETPSLQVFIARAAAELERELAIRALQKSEERYRTLVESAPLCIHQIDLQGRIQSMNAAGLRMIGANDADAVVGMQYLDMVGDEDRERVRRLYERAVAGEESHFEFATVGGQAVVSSCFIPLRDAGGLVVRLMAICEDVTERTRAQDALRELKERSDFALNATSDGVWDWNIKTGEVIYSPQWFRSLGYEPGELESHSRSWREIVHPEDMPRVQKTLKAHLEGHTEVYECENRLRMKSGEFRWNLDRGRVVAWDKDGRPTRMVGTDSDITRRKLAEERLRQSESELRLITDAMPALIAYVGADRCFQFVNKSYEELLGAERADIIGQPVRKILGERVSTIIWSRIDSALQGNRESYEAVFDFNGNDRIFSIEYIPDVAPDGEPRGFCSLVIDITDRRRAEETAQRHRDELAHVARLSTLGEMATGLAHELNQPLAAMATYADVCLARLASAPGDATAIVPILEKLKSQAFRAGSIVHRLRSFLRKTTFTRQQVRIDEAIGEVLALLELELKEQAISVDVQLPDSLPDVSGDAVQIEQVLLNLIRNALDAIVESDHSERRISLGAIELEEFLEIHVKDTGSGLGEESCEKAFDAFYSTKRDSMGMGLPICRTIIEAHGGSISIQPEGEIGVACRFTLPTGQNGAGAEHE